MRAALTEVEPQMPGMPADFWEDVEALLVAWYRGQRWCVADLASPSVARYARLSASFYGGNAEERIAPA